MNMGPWETRLAKLASAKADVSLPNADQLVSQLEALNRITTTAKDDVGLNGTAGEAATAALGSVASRADALSQSVASIQTQVDSANATRRNLANNELDRLDKDAPAGLNSTQANILQSAVTGATFFLGPLSIVAGPGAVAAVNNFMAANRESTARAAVQKVSDAMDAYELSTGSETATGARLPESAPSGPSSSTPGGTGGGTPGGGRLPAGGSFGGYPGAHIEPLSQVDTGGVISLPHTGGTIGGGHTGTGVTPGTGIDGSITPDGPISGGSTTPGWGSGGSNGGLGGGNGGFGSTPGLAAGAGGALALGGAKLVAARGGSMLGSGLNAKVGSLGAGGAGGAGGKLGGLSGAAESAAARSGSLAGAGRAGTGGLLGSGSGSGAAGAAGEGTAARGGAGAGMMGGAGGAGRSDEKRQGRGLGGPIAPKIDEDQERGPRSASAGPGGRG
jgi:hypothetical protein